MRIKIYYKVTNPLHYNLVTDDSVKIDSKSFKDVTSFNNKSILTFERKGRKLNFELFDIHALAFKINNACYSLINEDCEVIVKQQFLLKR